MEALVDDSGRKVETSCITGEVKDSWMAGSWTTEGPAGEGGESLLVVTQGWGVHASWSVGCSVGVSLRVLFIHTDDKKKK